MPAHRIGARFCAVVLAGSLGTFASAQDTGDTQGPIASIDWLSDSLQLPTPDQTALPAAEPPKIDEPDVADSATAPAVTVQPLGAQTITAVGLAPSATTGLPVSLWRDSQADTVTALIGATGVPRLPALQELFTTLMVAEAETPITTSPAQDVVLARVDALLRMGNVEAANALLIQVGPDTPALFMRWFDLALLTGTEDTACAALGQKPGLKPTVPTRVFCLARTGDWSAAALTLRTAEALDQVTTAQAALLTAFLDPELAESVPELAPTARLTPLEFVLREATGSPLPTRSLPLAFATTDLTDRNGWRAQIDAALRLSRAGSLPDNQLLGVLTANIPSASGGVWDDIDAWQALDVAVTTRDPTAVSAALASAWDAAGRLGVSVAFARLYAEKLQGLPLDAAAMQTRARITLLSDLYETAQTTALPFAVSVANGTPDAALAKTQAERAIVQAFSNASMDNAERDLLESNGLGEGILRAITIVEQGTQGDIRDISLGLAHLRRVGLEDVARRAALQILLLDDTA
ncbi:hypothetical protein [Nereida sp. MMG025]|uniref:hypothetical protein n=1 Tax=Nereida sp. MMG025 TaxID=2909981 RepID=UPI001F411088|nr:hypothetical protein [Nereida sp. MMG025]MCF6443202.1 hypothetical protein [Nereida sp. MMG025]